MSNPSHIPTMYLDGVNFRPWKDTLVAALRLKDNHIAASVVNEMTEPAIVAHARYGEPLDAQTLVRQTRKNLVDRLMKLLGPSSHAVLLNQVRPRRHRSTRTPRTDVAESKPDLEPEEDGDEPEPNDADVSDDEATVKMSKADTASGSSMRSEPVDDHWHEIAEDYDGEDISSRDQISGKDLRRLSADDWQIVAMFKEAFTLDERRMSLFHLEAQCTVELLDAKDTRTHRAKAKSEELTKFNQQADRLFTWLLAEKDNKWLPLNYVTALRTSSYKSRVDKMRQDRAVVDFLQLLREFAMNLSDEWTRELMQLSFIDTIPSQGSTFAEFEATYVDKMRELTSIGIAPPERMQILVLCRILHDYFATQIVKDFLAELKSTAKPIPQTLGEFLLHLRTFIHIKKGGPFEVGKYMDVTYKLSDSKKAEQKKSGGSNQGRHGNGDQINALTRIPNEGGKSSVSRDPCPICEKPHSVMSCWQITPEVKRAIAEAKSAYARRAESEKGKNNKPRAHAPPPGTSRHTVATTDARSELSSQSDTDMDQTTEKSATVSRTFAKPSSSGSKKGKAPKSASKTASRSTGGRINALRVLDWEPESDEDEDFISPVVDLRDSIATTSLRQRQKTQLDDGASINMLCSRKWFTSLYRVPDRDCYGFMNNAAYTITHEGETAGLGKAVYNPHGRNILSHGYLERKVGFTIDKIKEKTKRGNEVTVAYRCTYKGESIDFHADQQGLFFIDNDKLEQFLVSIERKGSFEPGSDAHKKFRPLETVADSEDDPFWQTWRARKQVADTVSPAYTRFQSRQEAGKPDPNQRGGSQPKSVEQTPTNAVPAIQRNAERQFNESMEHSSTTGMNVHDQYAEMPQEPRDHHHEITEDTPDDEDETLGELPERHQTRLNDRDPAQMLSADNIHMREAPEPENVAEPEIPPEPPPQLGPHPPKIYSQMQKRRAFEALRLHQALNHRSVAFMIELLESGALVNTELTRADVLNMQAIYGRCIACDRAKAKAPPPTAWAIPTDAIPGEYWEADLFYVPGDNQLKKKPLMLCVDMVSGTEIILNMESRSRKAFTNAGKRFGTKLKALFPEALRIRVRTDREHAFRHFATSFRGGIWVKCPNGSHPTTVERHIGVIKECMVAKLQELPYNLPGSLVPRLAEHVSKVSNFLPSSEARGNVPPITLCGGSKLQCSDALKFDFGQIVEAHIPPTVRPKTDTVGGRPMETNVRVETCIVVGFETATPSNVKVFVPRTGETVSRPVKIRNVPITEDLKAYMAAKATSSLTQAMLANSEHLFDKPPSDHDEDYIDDDAEENDDDAEQIDSTNAVYITAIQMQHVMDDSHMSIDKACLLFGEEAVMAAIKDELDNTIDKYDVYDFVMPNEVPKGAHVLSSIDFVKAKYADGKFTKLKFRTCTNGKQQKPGSYTRTSSPTVRQETVFALLAVSKAIKGLLSTVDIPGAYLRAPLQETVYMKLTRSMSRLLVKLREQLAEYLGNDGRVTVRLKKSLYGLKQSSVNWYDLISEYLVQHGLLRANSDSCLFVKRENENRHYVVLHVDDIMWTCNNKTWDNQFKLYLQEKFGPLDFQEREFDYLGMHIAQNPDLSVKVDLRGMTERILERHGISGSSQLPSSPETFFGELDDPKVDYSDKTDTFKSVVYELLYLTRVRVDIVKECNFLATLASNPGPKAHGKLLKLLNYLNRTKDYHLLLGVSEVICIVYADASYGVHVNGRSHSGIVACLGESNGTVLVKSTMQKLVTLSSTEAEIVAAVEATKVGINLSKLMLDLGFGEHIGFNLIRLKQDNTSAISIAMSGEGDTARTKHFLIRYGFLKDLYEKNMLAFDQVPTESMLADYLTKSLPGAKLFGFLSQVFGIKVD